MATTEIPTGEGGTTVRTSTGKSSADRTIPATLVSLPANPLQDVCTEADTHSLLALATTCKALNHFAEARLWRNVDLCLRDEFDDVFSAEEDQCGRLTVILTALQSHPERSSYIRSLRFTLSQVAGADFAKLFVRVSKTVRSLHIDKNWLRVEPTNWDLFVPEVLSSPEPPRLTSLRHLEIQCPLDVLSQLLNLMPNVQVVSSNEINYDRPEEQLSWPVMRSLRRLSMPQSSLENVYQLVTKCPAVEDLHLWDFDPPASARSVTPTRIQWLLDNVLPLPHLTRLAASDQSTTELALLSAIHLPTLQILETCYRPKCWAECRLEFIPIPPGFLHLRNVRIRVTQIWPERLSRLALRDISTASRQNNRVRPIARRLVELADAAPSLHSVQFIMTGRFLWLDRRDDESYGSRISTLVHGSQTVHIILSKTTSRPISYRRGLENDQTCACWPADSPSSEGTTWYEDAAAVEEIQTDFQGEIVPQEILEAMARIDGVERWEGRGIQVSEAAWEVLLDWYAQLVAGRA